MKKRGNKDFFIVIIIMIVLVAVLLKLRNQISYSIENESDTGFSVYYATLNKLNIPAKKILGSIYRQDTNTIQIIPSSENFDPDSDKVKNWISDGGILVYAIDRSTKISYIGNLNINNKNKICEYKFGKGHVIAVSAYELTNSELLVNTSVSYNLFRKLCTYNKKVYFNETYMFGGSDQNNLWDYIPLDIKIFFYQIVISILAFIWYKGKRFGKPVPYYEETERSENEYLYSVSSVFRCGKCYDIMLENYYENFLRTLNSNDSEWINYWKQNNLSEYKKAKEVYDFVHHDYKNKKSKEYLNVIRQLEYLTKYIRKRRESYWKILK